VHRRARGASQDGKLPLHYAAAKGVPLEVMDLLLRANPEAVTAADKVRTQLSPHAIYACPFVCFAAHARCPPPKLPREPR
jgi:hypothetical protein